MVCMLYYSKQLSTLHCHMSVLTHNKPVPEYHLKAFWLQIVTAGKTTLPSSSLSVVFVLTGQLKYSLTNVWHWQTTAPELMTTMIIHINLEQWINTLDKIRYIYYVAALQLDCTCTFILKSTSPYNIISMYNVSISC